MEVELIMDFVIIQRASARLSLNLFVAASMAD